MKKIFLLSLLFSFSFFGSLVEAASSCDDAYTFCLKRNSDVTVCESEKATCEANVTSNETTAATSNTASPNTTNTAAATTTVKSASTPFQSKFDPDKVFPSWDNGDNKVDGVIGRNKNEQGEIALDAGKTKLLLYFIPKLTSILFRVIAPIIVLMFIYSGVQFIYAGDDEELLKKSKSFVQYALIGVVLIVFSYSVMKSIYYLLSENTPAKDSTFVSLEITPDQDSDITSID